MLLLVSGGQIHDVHASFLYQYATTKEPMNIIIACGVDNIMSGDSSWSIIFQVMSSRFGISFNFRDSLKK